MPYGSFARDGQALSRDGQTVLMVRSTNLVPDELCEGGFHPIDDDAVNLYAKNGIQVFPAGAKTMFLPIETQIMSLTLLSLPDQAPRPPV